MTLPSATGHPPRFKFGPAAVILTLFGAIAASAATQPMNVLFIAVDDLRPELGCYGNSVVKSPNIDRLAKRGTTFTRAYCQQAVCSPSRSSIMTGMNPDTTQVWDLKTHFRVALPDVVTLSQHFKQNGYHAASLGKIYHRNFEDGRSWSEPAWFAAGVTVDTDPADFRKRKTERFGPGVSEYGEPGEAGDNDPDNARAARKRVAFLASPKSDDELPDGATAAEAIQRLRAYKQKRQPFFLAVGFVKPHLPFVAPKKYWDLYDPAKIPGAVRDQLPDGAPAFAGHDNGELHAYSNIPTGNPIPEALARQLRHGYYACVSYMDAQVGRLLDALDREGLADNTVIVLWGDHGWQLGDYGLWAKHTNFELATRVPLIVSMPQQRTAGAKCGSPVEFLDVYPTLAEACGLKVPDGLPGRSLRPMLDDPSVSVKPVAISQYPRGGGTGAGRNLMGYSLRDEQWRLTLWRDRRDGAIAATELYDLKANKFETINVAEKHPDVVQRLSRHLPALLPWKPASENTALSLGVTASAEADLSVSASAAPQPAVARSELFRRKDTDQNGALTLKEFLANLTDQEAAKKRFDKWDGDQNGTLTETEFVQMGKAK
jgi:arylsulfatase A-like enzyme